MSGDAAFELVTCPECRAANASYATKCWLCGGPLGDLSRAAGGVSAQGTVPAAGRPGAAAGASPFGGPPAAPPRGVLTYGLDSLLLLVTLAAVGFGIAREQPGLAVLYAIVVSPAVLATLVTAVRRRVRDRPMTTLEKLKLFGLSVVLAILALPVLAIAGVVALGIACLVILGRGGF